MSKTIKKLEQNELITLLIVFAIMYLAAVVASYWLGYSNYELDFYKKQINSLTVYVGTLTYTETTTSTSISTVIKTVTKVIS